MELKTPLYGAHVKAGGKIVPFAGWELSAVIGAAHPETLKVNSKKNWMRLL